MKKILKLARYLANTFDYEIDDYDDKIKKFNKLLKKYSIKKSKTIKLVSQLIQNFSAITVIKTYTNLINNTKLKLLKIIFNELTTIKPNNVKFYNMNFYKNKRLIKNIYEKNLINFNFQFIRLFIEYNLLKYFDAFKFFLYDPYLPISFDYKNNYEKIYKFYKNKLNQYNLTYEKFNALLEWLKEKELIQKKIKIISINNKNIKRIINKYCNKKMMN